MPDLHGWLSQKVTAVEERARRASAWGVDWYHDDCVNEIRDYGNGNTIAIVYLAQYADQIISQDPAATLRRCAADRKILEIHRYKGGSWEPYACDGCGADDVGALVDHANDCETLLALAEGYGLTDDERAALDRPERERREEPYRLTLDDIRPTVPTSAVPTALRGPNWKAKP
jgi:hypothetical protein